jgi:hypothetical protein
MTPREPNLRAIRLLLIRTLDKLPTTGPEWHPTFQVAKRVREHIREAKREVEQYLGPED